MIATILLALSLACFVISTFWTPPPPRNLIAAGLAFWVLAELLSHAGAR